MRGEIHADIVGEQYSSLGVEQEGSAVGVASRGRGGGTECLSKRARLVICPQLECEAPLVMPPSVGLGRIEADADDAHADGVEVTLEVAVPATLDGSTSGVGGGVEPEGRRFALKI